MENGGAGGWVNLLAREGQVLRVKINKRIHYILNGRMNERTHE